MGSGMNLFVTVKTWKLFQTLDLDLAVVIVSQIYVALANFFLLLKTKNPPKSGRSWNLTIQGGLCFKMASLKDFKIEIIEIPSAQVNV